MAETRADRMNRIGDDIGYALGRGEYPWDQIREFRWLWRITPDSEKSGVRFNLKDIEDLVRDLRQEEKAAQTPEDRVAVFEWRRPGMCNGSTYNPGCGCD